ncbi:hypothetical protein Hanom_Chr01g00067871 [Helianthus anomalus]
MTVTIFLPLSKFKLLFSLIIFHLFLLFHLPILSTIMSIGTKPTTRKRKYKPRNPPGPDQAEINWKEEELQTLTQDLGFRSDWGVQFPAPKSTTLDTPPRYMALYADFFREGNFRLLMSKFVEVLTGYGLHISQISALGLPRVTHFEFICRANRVDPTFDKFNVFYFVSYTGGFYSFNSCTSDVKPCSSHPPKSLHDWKQKFFYIRRRVIPMDMHYRAESEWAPCVNISLDFTEQEWYKVLTRKVSPIIQLEERALVAAGMSMLWASPNPRGFPIYGYQGKAGYSLMNVFDPKAVGAMVVAILPEGRPLSLDQIRNNFLHPTPESMAAYANAVLGEDDEDDIDVGSVPTREEVIVLSSEGSDGSHEGLIHRSTRAGPPQWTANEPVIDDRKGDKTEEKKAKEPVLENPRKRPSNSSFLDYAVVSDTLSGLDTEVKRSERDPDDDATLTEIMKKKKKALREKKKELDAQADTATEPSESEIDLGVFSAKAGNLLEKMYKSAGSLGPKPGKGVHKIDISKITPPTSPPSKPLDLSPPHPDIRGKGKEDEVEQVRKVVEDVVAGAGGGEDNVEGVEANVESSEATPQQGTIYTKRVAGSGGGVASGTRKSPELTHIQSGSWGTQNPACDDLPHAPRWNLTQGSRMNDIANCRELYSLSLPQLKGCFGKNATGWTSWIIIFMPWQLMGEDTMEFEAAKRELAEKGRSLMLRKRVCYGGFLMRKRSLPKRNSSMPTNRRSGRLPVVESKASKILAEETTVDCKWLLARAVPLISERITKSDELARYMYELGEAAYNSGRKDGYAEGRATTLSNEKDYHFELYKQDCTAAYTATHREYEFIEFGIVKAVEKLSRKTNAIEVLKKALGDQDPEGGDAGPSHQG